MKKLNLFAALAAAACAATLSLSLAGIARADDGTEDGRLGKIHKAQGVACHGDGDFKALALKTAATKPLNPHENRHYGNQANCGLCHRQHDVSVNFCADCHPRFDFKVK